MYVATLRATSSTTKSEVSRTGHSTDADTTIVTINTRAVTTQATAHATRGLITVAYADGVSRGHWRGAPSR